MIEDLAQVLQTESIYIKGFLVCLVLYWLLVFVRYIYFYHLDSIPCEYCELKLEPSKGDRRGKRRWSRGTNPLSTDSSAFIRTTRSGNVYFDSDLEHADTVQNNHNNEEVSDIEIN